MAALRVTLVVTLAATRVDIVTSHAGPDSSLQEHDAGSLLQNDIGVLHNDARQDRKSKLKQPYPAAWFGGFSEGESTYDYDGANAHRHTNPEINVLDGWNPKQKNPFYDKAVDRQWFQESKSGGAKQAWQSDYPTMEASVSGSRVETGPWFEGSRGVFQQEYLASRTGLNDGHPSASWFDGSVNQLDGFGRQKMPALGSPRNYLEWEEKSVNATLTCKAPGCTANVSLVAPFNFNTEMYKNCRLNVLFHPTDFDAQYSRETVEWVQVNGRKVSSSCRLLASGCNQTAARPLLPCVDDVGIDLLLDQTSKNGDLHVSAKIPDYVDECPYQGNMLSAVPVVTCLVSPKHPFSHPDPKTPVTLLDNATCVTKMPLQCATRGCASEVAIHLNSSCVGLGQCLLSIEVQQTDYDGDAGTEELIEYIKVNNQSVASKVKPGQNPCKLKYGGKQNLSLAETSFMALSNHPLNLANGDGRIVLEGKISKFVDECASEGYLFNALATVTCGKPLTQPASLSEAAAGGATGGFAVGSGAGWKHEYGYNNYVEAASLVHKTASVSKRRQMRIKRGAQ